jgi:hypothetical protein
VVERSPEESERCFFYLAFEVLPLHSQLESPEQGVCENQACVHKVGLLGRLRGFFIGAGMLEGSHLLLFIPQPASVVERSETAAAMTALAMLTAQANLCLRKCPDMLKEQSILDV